MFDVSSINQPEMSFVFSECETEDVDIPAEGCLGFSQVEIIDASERTPSVIEILAAVALAPMIAVPAADQPAALTSAELSTLHELTDLALTEIKTRAGEVTAHDLEVIPEEPNDITLQEEFLIDLKNLPPPPALDDMSTDYIIENLILKPPDEIVELVTYIPIVEPPPEIEQETVESEQTNAKAIALQAGTSSVGEASQLLDTTHSREQTVLHESIAIEENQSVDEIKSNLAQVVEGNSMSLGIEKPAITEEIPEMLEVQQKVINERWSSGDKNEGFQPETVIKTNAKVAKEDLTSSDIIAIETSEAILAKVEAEHLLAEEKRDRSSGERISVLQPESIVEIEAAVASPDTNNSPSFETKEDGENVAQKDGSTDPTKSNLQPESVVETETQVAKKDLTSSHIIEIATTEESSAILDVKDTVGQETQDPSSEETKSDLQPESLVGTEKEVAEKDLTLPDVNGPPTSETTPVTPDVKDTVAKDKQDRFSEETKSDFQPEFVVKDETEVAETDLASPNLNELASNEAIPLAENTVAQHKQDRSSDKTDSQLESVAKTVIEVTEKDLTSSNIKETATSEAIPATLEVEDTVAHKTQDRSSDETKSNLQAESVVKTETEAGEKDLTSSDINEPATSKGTPPALDAEDMVGQETQDGSSDETISDIQPESVVKTETEVSDKDLTSSDINEPESSEPNPVTLEVEDVVAQQKQDRSSDETKSDIRPDSIAKTETEVAQKDLTSSVINEPASCEATPPTLDAEDTVAQEAQDQASDKTKSNIEAESVVKAETEVSDKDFISSNINEPESTVTIPVTLEVEDVVAQQKQDRFSDEMKSDIQSDSIAKTETEVVQKDLTSSDISEPATSEATPPTVDVEAAAAQEKQGRSSDEANLQPEFVTKTETEVAEKDLTSSDVNELATSEATEATSDAEGTVAQETQDRSSDETISDIQPESVLKTETEVSDKDLTSSDINEPESSEPIPVTLEVEDMIAQQKQDRSSDEMKSDIQSDSIAKTETEIAQKDLTSSDISEPATSKATPPTVDVEAAAAQEKQDRSSDETKLQPEFVTKTETEVAEKDLTSSDVNELPTSEATPATLDVGDTAAQETQDQSSDERKPDLKPAVIARAKVISSDVNNSVTSETTPATVEVKSTVEHEEHVESSDETRSDLRLESTQQTEQKIGEEYITSMGLSGQDKLLESISDISVQALELIREEPKLDESNIASDLESSEIPILEPPAGFNEECETNIAVEEKETNESNVEKIIKENEEKASSEKLLFNMEEKVKSSETIHSTINQLISTENELTFTEKKEAFEIEQSRAKTNLNLHEELFSVAEQDENLSIKKSRHPSLGVIECQPTIIETFAISFEESTDNAFTDATTDDNLSRETSSCSFVATQRAKGNEDLEESAALKAQDHSTALSTQHTPQEVLEKSKALIGKPEEESKSSEKEAMVLLGPLPHEGSKVGEEAINAQNPSTENQQLNADAQVTVEEQSHEERNVNIEMNANSPSPSQDEVIPPPVAFESEYILTNQSCETSAENAVKTVNLLAENSAIKNESIPDNIESSQASITKFETNPENLKVIEEKAEESSQFPQEKTIVEEQAGKLDSTAVSTEIVVVPIVDSTMPDTSQKAATTSTIKSNEIIPSADINSTKEGHETRQPSEILPCVGADIQKNVLSDSPNISVVVPAREATTIASHVTTPSTEINSASVNRETSQPAETSPSAEAVLHKTVLTDTPDTSVIATQDPDTNSACNETNRSNEVTSANEGQKIIQPSGIEKIGNDENISIALDPEIIQSCPSLPGLVALNGTAITEDNVTEPKENVLISICNEKIKDSANSGEEEFVRSTEPLSTSIKIAIQEEILTQQGEKTDENSANISSIESSEATTLTSVINVAGKQTECKNDPIESEIPTVCCQSSTEPASIVKDEKTPIPAKEEIDSTKHLPKTSSEETVVSSSELSNSSATSVNVEESVVSETIVNAFATSNLRALDLEKSSVEQLSTKKEPQTSLEHASMDAIEIGSANLSKEQAPEIPIQEQHTLMKSEISTMALIDSGKEHVPDVLIQEEYEIQISETPLVDTSKEQVSEELIQGQHTQVKSELNHEDPKLTVLTKQETLTFDQTVSEKSRMEIIPENITTNVAHVSLLQTLNQEHLETSSATTCGNELRDPSDVINQGQKSLSQNQRFDSAEENLIKSSIPSADEILRKSSDETNENIAAFTADRAAIPVQKLDTVKDILLSAEPSVIAEDLATKISEIKLTQTATILKEEQSLQISPKLTMINEENSEIAMGYTIAEISDQPSRNNALVSENIFEVGKAEQSIEAVTAPNLEKHYASEEQATQNLKEIDIPSGSTESEQKELKAPADSIELKQEPVVLTICEAATNQPLTGLLSQFTTDSNTIESVDAIDIIAPPIMFATPDTVTNKVVEPEKPVNVPSAPIASNKFNTKPLEENALACLSDSYTIVEPIKVRNSSLEAKEAHLSTESTATSTTSDKTVIEVLNVKPQQAVEACHSIPNEVKKSSVLDREPAQLVTATSYNLPMSSQKLLTNSNPAENLNKYRFLTDVVVSDQLETVSNGTIKSNESTEHLYNINDSGIEAIVSLENQSQSNLNLVTISTKVTLETDKKTFSETNLKFGVKEKIFCEEKKLRIESEKLLTESYRDSITTLKPIKAEDIPLMNRTNVSEEKEELDSTLAKEQLQISATGSKDIVKKIRDSDSVDFIASDSSKSDPLPAKENIQELIANALRETAELKSSSHTSTHITVDVEKEVSECTITGPEHRPTSLINEETISLAEKNFSELTITNRNEKLAPSSEILEAKKESLQTSASEVLLKPDLNIHEATAENFVERISVVSEIPTLVSEVLLATGLNVVRSCKIKMENFSANQAPILASEEPLAPDINISRNTAPETILTTPGQEVSILNSEALLATGLNVAKTFASKPVEENSSVREIPFRTSEAFFAPELNVSQTIAAKTVNETSSMKEVSIVNSEVLLCAELNISQTVASEKKDKTGELPILASEVRLSPELNGSQTIASMPEISCAEKPNLEENNSEIIVTKVEDTNLAVKKNSLTQILSKTESIDKPDNISMSSFQEGENGNKNSSKAHEKLNDISPTELRKVASVSPVAEVDITGTPITSTEHKPCVKFKENLTEFAVSICNEAESTSSVESQPECKVTELNTPNNLHLLRAVKEKSIWNEVSAKTDSLSESTETMEEGLGSTIIKVTNLVISDNEDVSKSNSLVVDKSENVAVDPPEIKASIDSAILSQSSTKANVMNELKTTLATTILQESRNESQNQLKAKGEEIDEKINETETKELKTSTSEVLDQVTNTYENSQDTFQAKLQNENSSTFIENKDSEPMLAAVDPDLCDDIADDCKESISDYYVPMTTSAATVRRQFFPSNETQEESSSSIGSSGMVINELANTLRRDETFEVILAEAAAMEVSVTPTNKLIELENAKTGRTVEEGISVKNLGNHLVLKKLRRQACVSSDTAPSLEDDSQESKKIPTTNALGSICQQYIQDKRLLAALETRRRQTLLMHRFLSSFEESPHSSMENELIAAYQSTVELTDANSSRIGSVECSSINSEDSSICDCDNSYLVGERQHENSFHIFNNILFSDQITNEYCSSNNTPTTDEEFIEIGLDVEIEHKQQQSQSNHNNNNNNSNNTYVRLVNNNGNAIPTTTPNTCNKKKNNNGNNNNNHNKNNIDHHYHHYHHNNTTSGREASAVEVTTLKAEQIIIGQNNKIEDYKDDDIDNQILEREHVDDMVAVQPKFVPGTFTINTNN
ncbi:hypothetical protein GQX74_013311 [Glossina fuscipes]|nr:hypothetical protein GQX74_013311 [Glossina fuscipes]